MIILKQGHISNITIATLETHKVWREKTIEELILLSLISSQKI